MNTLKLSAFAAITVALVSCGSASTSSSVSAIYGADVLKSITATGNLMPGPGRRNDVKAIATIEVVSSGCTTEDSYSVKSIQNSTTSQTIKIARIIPDNCEAVSRRIEIQVRIENFAPHSKVMYNGKEFKNVTRHYVY
jgi:hypothetical protein